MPGARAVGVMALEIVGARVGRGAGGLSDAREDGEGKEQELA